MEIELMNEFINIDSNISVIVKDLTNELVLIDYNGDCRVSSASIIKIVILLAVFKAVNEKKLKLTDNVFINSTNNVDFSTISEEGLQYYTVEELANWMIITSDNSASNALIDLLGFEYINSLCNEINLSSTLLQRKMMDYQAIKKGRNNYTCNRDMLLLMQMLYKNEFISSHVSNEILGIMLRQRDNSKLTRYICDNIKVAHKSGELEGIDHDMGIVYSTDIDYYIGVFINGTSENEYNSKLIGKLSKNVYKYIKEKYLKRV